MVDEGLERYQTARHEGIHALAALAFGHSVLSIDVDQGTTVLTWACSHHVITPLFHRDPARAVGLITGAIAACLGPAADERASINAGDQAVLDRWHACWTITDPCWSNIYCQAGVRVRRWLREPTTGIAISRLTLALYVAEAPVEGERLQRLLVQATAPATTPTTTTVQQPYSTHNERKHYVGSHRSTRSRYSSLHPQFFVAGAAR